MRPHQGLRFLPDLCLAWVVACALVPAGAKLFAEETDTRQSQRKRVEATSRALMALLGICVAGLALIAVTAWGAHRIRRLTRRTATKTVVDPLWFLKHRETHEDTGRSDEPP